MSFKKAVQSSFSRAAETYKDFSEAQQKAADDLVRLLLSRLAEQATALDTKFSILDIGCGPGVLEAKLQKHLPNMNYVGIDLSHMMTLEADKTKTLSSSNFVAADMDSLPFQNDSFDIVLSSSTLQWSQPETFPWMQEVHRVLRPSGIFCFNHMSEGSLENFYLTYQSVCNDFFSLHSYPNQVLLESELKEMFLDCLFEEKNYQKVYPNLMDFLRDIQKTGARSASIKGKTRLTKKKILKIEEKLRNTEGKIPIDYRFCFASGKKA